ncbi:MAG TPA: hypothetical protein DIS68_06770 [Lachnospiraceae bacterium]|nr:hypothetical protein [Lachnospiraceae bacterium]MBQ5534144.1 hypothetical protein [Lachnospiraceae bacterium]HAL31768.1 hypothetical protein [Lachnospiraceae bacterium]HBB59944.1 hypothetical protein [Lachnospiraceae bacterium]HCS00493.1 hypothetical protein [Lachnospiraceae bacterium]
MKKFVIKCICFALILGVIFVPFSVFVDPFNIFHINHPRNNGLEPNKNYMKMHNVLNHPDKYDSFLFGSSRVGFIDVTKMNDGKYYDMMYSEGTPAEHLDNLKVMTERGIIPKNVIIGVDDITYFVDPALHVGQLYRLPYPWDGTLSDKAVFYLRYFDLITLSQSLEAMKKSKKKGADPDYNMRLLDTGTENLDIPPQFDYEDAKPWWSDYYYPREQSLEDIRQIKELCDEYGINLRVFTNPLHAMTYAKGIDNGYLVFLKELAEITPYWNFSGFNDVTLDYSYYYETSHYCPAVGDMIIDNIYYDKHDDRLLAQGFGTYVTSDNVDELIGLLKEQAVNYDLPVETYKDTVNRRPGDEETEETEETGSETEGRQ